MEPTIDPRRRTSNRCLQYYMHDGARAFRFGLGGDLSDEGATGLEQAWLTASSTIGERDFLVDLTGLTSIGKVGRELLLRWRDQGASFHVRSHEARGRLKSILGLGLTLKPENEAPRRRWRLALKFRPALRILRTLVFLLPVIALAGNMTVARPSSHAGLAFGAVHGVDQSAPPSVKQPFVQGPGSGSSSPPVSSWS